MSTSHRIVRYPGSHITMITTIVIMTGRYADSFLLSAKANRGEGIRFENIRGSKIAHVDNSREPVNGRAKANVSEDLPMSKMKIELQGDSLGVFLSWFW